MNTTEDSIATYLLKKEDIKIFYANEKKYILYTPKNVIFAVENEYFEKYISLSLFPDNKNIKIERNTVKDIHDYFFETIEKLSNTKVYVNETSFKPSCIVLNISGDCNLLCPYCFARNSDGFLFDNMSLDVATASIDFMIKSNPDEKEYTISFFGGEPLLRVNDIEKVIEYTLKTYPDKNFVYSTTTNGTILTEKIIYVIKKYNISILLSIDGPENITNRNRPYKTGKKNTFNEIMKNAQILKDKGVDFSFRATIIAGENNLVDYASFFESLKIGYYLATRYCNFVSCGAGINMFAVNADQTIYNCMNFAPIAETTIGSINLGISKQINAKYRPKFIEETECKSCNIRYLCGGGCIAERYVNFRETNKLNTKFCQLQNIVFDNYLTLFQQIKNFNPDLIDNIANHTLIYEKI